MAISQVDIGNMALDHLGTDSTIESLDEQSAEAAAIKLWYDISVRSALEDLDWTFARRRRTLVLHDDDPPSGIWTYRYQYPENAVKIRSLANPAGLKAAPVPYEIELSDNGETRSILTNLQSAVAVYTSFVTSVGLYSAGFIEALSYQIAMKAAFRITGRRDIKKDLFDQYAVVMRHAAGSNAMEGMPDAPPDADWIAVRSDPQDRFSLGYQS